MAQTKTKFIEDAAITHAKVAADIITGATAETTPDNADLILIYDDTGTALKKMTRANFVGTGGSTGDIGETAFAGAESAAGASVTGFAFANGTVRSFEAIVHIEIDAATDLFEEYTIKGIQRGADWVITTNSRGDDTSVTFDINTSGQITYSSSTYTTFVSMDITFRAITTTV
jgi:hypothetical protein